MQAPKSVSNSLSPNGSGTGQEALKQFQTTGNTSEKSSEEFGKKIVLQVEDIINSSYFTERNQRITLNKAMAAGRMNMTKFADFFNINGKTNYVNISWKSIMIVNTIIARLVGRWMTKREKAAVEAKDPISIKKKKDQYDEAEFLLEYQDKLKAVEEESGVPMIDKGAFIPDDKDHLDLWAQEEQRIPEEILFEKGINDVMDENGLGNMGVINRRLKHDSAESGLIGLEVYADKYGRIKIDHHQPENMFYSFSQYDDFRDSDIKGVVVSMKLSKIRELYPALTMPELFEIAKESKQWVTNNRITYDTGWNGNMNLPFDDWDVDAVRFTLKTLDTDKTLIKRGRDGGLYMDKPKQRIDQLYPGNEYVEKKIWNIYRGVYIRTSKRILEWGLEKNMIRPQDYKRIGEAKSPFHMYMYQNVAMRNLAVPEKIEEPVEQMILARLKIQQLVAKLHPSGYKYDIDGLQEMDLGNGIMKPLELQKITDQTGNVYFRSRDAEGNRLENPITENPNAGSVPQLQALIEIYNYHLQVLRDEIGSNEFSEGQTIKPRVGNQNVQTSLEISFNSIDYMNDATIALKQDVAESIACLLHDSVEFGSKEYRDLMKEEDVKERDFCTRIEMLPTTEEITNLDAVINNAINAQPDLVLYLNPEKIKRIARENVKLAELYFRQGQRRAIEGQMKMKQQDSQMNAQNQIASNKSASEGKIAEMQQEMQLKAQLEIAISKEKQKESLFITFGTIYSKGIPVPAELKGLETQVIKNMEMSLYAENTQGEQAIQEGAQEIAEEGEMEEDELPEQKPQMPQEEEVVM